MAESLKNKYTALNSMIFRKQITAEHIVNHILESDWATYLEYQFTAKRQLRKFNTYVDLDNLRNIILHHGLNSADVGTERGTLDELTINDMLAIYGYAYELCKEHRPICPIKNIRNQFRYQIHFKELEEYIVEHAKRLN